MRAFASLCIALGLLLPTSCKAVGAWLDEPAEPAQPETITIPLGEGGEAVTVTVPPGQTEPFPYTMPDGTVVTITPSQPAEGAPTKGDAVARAISGVVGGMTGNPLLGFGALAAARLVIGAVSGEDKKKAPGDVPAGSQPVGPSDAA